MKFAKKIGAIAAAAAMLTAVTACSANNTSSDSAASGAADGKTYKIGITQMMDHPALNQSNEGFIAALADKGYVDGENITISNQNGQGETANLNTIATQFVGDEVDLIFAIATPAAQAAQGQTTEIPIIGTAITDFAVAGLVNSNENPGTNVSGTTDMNPIKEQIDLLLKLAPETKTVGFLYNSSEDNSVLQTDIAKAYLDEKGIAWTEKTVSSTNEVQQATTSIASEVDAIYIPTDNIFASSMSIVGEVAAQNKIPVITGETGMAEGGGLATLGINYYNLGYQAGLMAVRVLEGEDISTMPIEGSTEFEYYINGDTVEALGITIPEDLQQYVQTPGEAE